MTGGSLRLKHHGSQPCDGPALRGRRRERAIPTGCRSLSGRGNEVIATWSRGVSLGVLRDAVRIACLTARVARAAVPPCIARCALRRPLSGLGLSALLVNLSSSLSKHP